MPSPWTKLDNAAKIFPTAVRGAGTQVFRFSCELKDMIDPKILQDALDETVPEFPVYQCILKRGWFWYYLEETNDKPEVCQEYKNPCARIYDKDKPGLLYEVTYYKKRINLEVFHVLTDGTGAMQFLKTLVAKYISKVLKMDEPFLDYDASHSQREKDSFQKYYQKDKIKNRSVKAARVKGSKLSENRLKAITGHMSVKKLINQAHEYDATITEYLCGCLIYAIGEDIPFRKRKRPVIISVPVNLRKYFPSKSARNFFSVSSCSYKFGTKDTQVSDIVEKVRGDFKRNLTPKNLAENMNTMTSLEHNAFVRITPLIFKDISLRAAYEYSLFTKTANLSNVGRVSMPPEISGYIRSFDVAMGTNDVQVCICSFNDTMSVTFTSPFVSTDIPCSFFRILTGSGIDVEISTNFAGEEEI